MRLPPGGVRAGMQQGPGEAEAGPLQDHSTVSQQERAEAGRSLAQATVFSPAAAAAQVPALGQNTLQGSVLRAQGPGMGGRNLRQIPHSPIQRIGQDSPRAWPTHSRGLSTGIATGQEGWAHQAPSPYNDDNATEPLYKQFIYSKQQHRQTPYKHKGRGAGRDAANFGSEAH